MWFIFELFFIYIMFIYIVAYIDNAWVIFQGSFGFLMQLDVIKK